MAICSKLSMQDIFWYSATRHADDMARSTQVYLKITIGTVKNPDKREQMNKY